MASPLYGVAAMNAIGFGVYGNVIRRLNNPDSITSITTAGVAAGGVQVSTIIKMRHLAQLFYHVQPVFLRKQNQYALFESFGAFARIHIKIYNSFQ